MSWSKAWPYHKLLMDGNKEFLAFLEEYYGRIIKFSMGLAGNEALAAALFQQISSPLVYLEEAWMLYQSSKVKLTPEQSEAMKKIGQTVEPKPQEKPAEQKWVLPRDLEGLADIRMVEGRPVVVPKYLPLPKPDYFRVNEWAEARGLRWNREKGVWE